MNSDILYQISFDDLKVSKVIYENENYSNSLYHFHQSQEKLIKSIALKINLIEENELKKIGHNFIILYDKYINYIKKDPIISNLIGDYNLSNVLEKSKELSPLEFIEFIIMQYEYILNLEFLREKKVNETYFDLLVDYFTSLDYINQIPEFQQMLDFINEDDDIMIELVKSQLEDFSEQSYLQMKHGPKILLILLINCFFCSYYKPDEFRYSSNKINNPIEFFNKTNPIVITLKPLINNMIELYKYIPHIKFPERK